MCRAPKSRQGDHFHIVADLQALLEGFIPKIPDWGDDHHTIKGKRLGRGLAHFRVEPTKLVSAPAERDPYEDEAYLLWELSHKVPRLAMTRSFAYTHRTHLLVNLLRSRKRKHHFSSHT